MFYTREGETDLVPGPVILTRDDITHIFDHSIDDLCGAMQLVDLQLRRFNPTAHYMQHGSVPSCWVSIWRKTEGERKER